MIWYNGLSDRYECDDPRVRLVDVLERKNISPPIFTLVLFLHDGTRQKFGGKPFSFTDKLIKEAEEWLATLPATDRGYEGL